MNTFRVILLSVIVSVTPLLADDGFSVSSYAPNKLSGYGYFAWGYNNGTGTCRVNVTGNDSGWSEGTNMAELAFWAVEMADTYDGYYAYGDGYLLFESGAP